MSFHSLALCLFPVVRAMMPHCTRICQAVLWIIELRPAERKLNQITATFLFFLFKHPSLDFSVVELLDKLSPIAAHEQCKPSSRRLKPSQRGPTLTTPKPICRSLRTPVVVPYRPNCLQDLEESQILEDIFFICWQEKAKHAKFYLLKCWLCCLDFFFLSIWDRHVFEGKHVMFSVFLIQINRHSLGTLISLKFGLCRG